MARQGPADAGELDRQEPGAALPLRWSPLPAREGPGWVRAQRALRSEPPSAEPNPDPSLAGSEIDSFEVFTTRPDTIFGASFAAISPDHPIALALAEENEALAAFIAECKQGGTTAAELETAEKKGFDTGVRVVHPLDPDWTLPLYVANFVLMDYGTGAIFGCPAHDQRDLDFARKYGLPVTRVVAPSPEEADEPIGDEAYVRAGPAGEQPLPRRPDRRGRNPRGHRPRRGGRLGRGHDGVAAARLGRLAAALLGDSDPDHPLRGLRPGAGAARSAARRPARGHRLRDPGQSARPPSDLVESGLSGLRRAGAARDRHARHLRRFLLVFHPLRQPAGRLAVRPRRGRALASGRPVYRRRRACDPAPALCPLLDPGAEADRPARRRGAVQGPLHPGHGHPRHLPGFGRALADARGGRRA